MKRVLTMLLALVMLLCAVPAVSAQEAEQTQPVQTAVPEETVAPEKEETPEEEPVLLEEDLELVYRPESVQEADNDELFAGYVDSVFYPASDKVKGTAAGSRLTGDLKLMYDGIVYLFKQVASGQRSSTEIIIGDYYNCEYKGSLTGSTLTQAQFNTLMDAVLADLPYEQYWYDKTTGVKLRLVRYSDGTTSVTFSFTVADNYKGSDDYHTKTSITGAATKAATNARAIVAANANLSDYDKLVAYKNKICSMVSYDHAAADRGDFYRNNDPWQMIHVFDGNSSTNVVCEGYSKAYMYLCENSTFMQDITCYTVTGDLNTPGAGHMWNIVSINGKNYLVDITNSDSGTVGQNGGLFLNGASGSIASGYSFMNKRVYFYYDEDDKALWGTGTNSILYLSSTDYDPNSFIGGKCGDNLFWKLEGSTLTIQGTGAMYDYTTTTQPWNSYKDQIVTVKILTGATTVGQCAFAYCENLYNVMLPDTITAFKNGAFMGCKKLCGATLPRNLTSIGQNAFYNCRAMTEIVIPSKVKSIDAMAFDNCTGLKRITFLGAAPTFAADVFKMVVADAYCDYNNGGWTEDVMQDYGGTITWHCDNQPAPEPEAPEVTPMYRLYNPNSGEHFYTGSTVERDTLVGYGWIYEGIAWNAPVDGGEPVYRLFNPNNGDHHYTMSTVERDNLVSVGWQYEGIAWNSVAPNDYPQYRLYNPNADCGSHHYTGSTEERDYLVSLGWRYEGIGWYGLP